MIEKILLPLDGSHSCSRARELTAALAKKFGSEITIMHVIYHDFMHPELKANYNLPPLVLEKLDETYREAGEKILKAAKDFFHEEHISVETILEKADDPADSILQQAKESNYDLIIMGNISAKNAYRYSLGSVAEKVSFHALCPVIITKRKTRISKLLVAYDSSEQANKALKYAVNLCRNFEDSKMTILNVENGDLHRLEPDLASKIGELILDKATPSLEGVAYDRHLEFGNAADIILKIAKMENYDLVVVGSRGLSRIKRFLLGSVAADVSMHAQRSVLIVR